MNVHQISMQLQNELQTITWGVGTNAVVFGTQEGVVEVFADAPTPEQFPPAFPCCLIVIGSGDPDDDHPALMDQSFQLVIGALSHGDPRGSHSLVGGSTSDLGTSENRGVLEILPRVRKAVGDSIWDFTIVTQSFASPFTVGNLKHVAFAQLTVSAKCLQDIYYAPPQQMEEPSTGTFTWDGQHCLDRYDFLGFEIMEKSDSQSSSTSDGVSVYTGSALTATFGVNLGDYYTIFAKYDDRGDGTSDGESSALLGTWVVSA